MADNETKPLASSVDVGWQDGKPRIGEAKHFEGPQSVFGEGQAVFANPGFGLDDLADTGKEPRVEGCGYLDVFVGQTFAHGLGDDADTVRGSLRKGRGDGCTIWRARNVDFIKASEAGFQ